MFDKKAVVSKHGKVKRINFFFTFIKNKEALVTDIFDFTRDNDNQSTEMFQKKLAQVIYTMINTSQFYSLHVAHFKDWETKGPNVRIGYYHDPKESKHTKKVVKFYDYRKSSQSHYKRSPNGYLLLKDYFVNLEIKEICKDFTVLYYDYIVASHIPSNVSQLYDIYQQINLLHKSNKVHGDLRLSNMLFSKEKNLLIDLDFVDNPLYPPNLNLSLQDTKRSDRIISLLGKDVECYKEKDDDWFSFGSICSFFAIDSEHNSTWKDICYQFTHKIYSSNNLEILKLHNLVLVINLNSILSPFDLKDGASGSPPSDEFILLFKGKKIDLFKNNLKLDQKRLIKKIGKNGKCCNFDHCESDIVKYFLCNKHLPVFHETFDKLAQAVGINTEKLLIFIILKNIQNYKEVKFQTNSACDLIETLELDEEGITLLNVIKKCVEEENEFKICQIPTCAHEIHTSYNVCEYHFKMIENYHNILQKKSIVKKQFSVNDFIEKLQNNSK